MEELKAEIERVARETIGAAIQVHRTLGPGLLESIYERCLAHELDLRGLRVRRQQAFPVKYGDTRMDIGFRADLVVEDLVIVEIKSVESLAPVHRKQLLTYLTVAEKRFGLVLNFGAEVMRDGIRRVVNDL